MLVVITGMLYKKKKPHLNLSYLAKKILLRKKEKSSAFTLVTALVKLYLNEILGTYYLSIMIALMQHKVNIYCFKVFTSRKEMKILIKRDGKKLKMKVIAFKVQVLDNKIYCYPNICIWTHMYVMYVLWPLIHLYN